ncbi:MAG: flagellar hook-associated protein FlgL [Gammaproteobacteria bacterium]|nr:flagellar hook-associated protein FlgL [Gammaproteobacteria bacterium]
MRVSTIGAYNQGVELMQRLQVALDHTQRQIASGRRLLTPSDDPIAAGRALNLRESLSQLVQFDRNANLAGSRLGYEESALTSASNILHRVRELALQANNATQTQEAREFISIEIRQLLGELVDVANQQDGNGRYMFAGTRDATLPVTHTGGSYVYNGDQGQRLVQIADNRQVADGDPGSEVFFHVRNGNGTFVATPAAFNAGSGILNATSVVDAAAYDRDTYTIRFIDPVNYEVLDSSAAVVASGAWQSGDSIAFSGLEVAITGTPAAGDEFVAAPSKFQDIFTTVYDLADAVMMTADDDQSRAALNNSVNLGLQNLDQALGRILEVRTSVGSRLSAVEIQRDTNEAYALTTQQTLSELEDLDYAEALSRLSIQASVLEAAQASFVRTQSLSLFNFL